MIVNKIAELFLIFFFRALYENKANIYHSLKFTSKIFLQYTAISLNPHTSSNL